MNNNNANHIIIIMVANQKRGRRVIFRTRAVGETTTTYVLNTLIVYNPKL